MTVSGTEEEHVEVGLTLAKSALDPLYEIITRSAPKAAVL
jgi:hypothetical protein